MTHSHDTTTPAMSAETVPSEEFVLVPREPTPAMQRAYFDSIDTNMHRVEKDVRFGRYENMRTAYRAMIAAAPAPNPSPAAKGGDAVREALVKPLEWRRFDRDREFAQTPFGRWLTDSVSGFVTVEFRGVIEGEPHPTVEAAKAFAQADYDRRIRAALSTPTEGPASQTDGMGGDAEARRKRASELMAPLMELSEDELILLRHSLPVETLARLRAALTPPETAEAVPVASDPAPATDALARAEKAQVALLSVREAMLMARDVLADPSTIGIDDTIWMPEAVSMNETLHDYLERAAEFAARASREAQPATDGGGNG